MTPVLRCRFAIGDFVVPKPEWGADKLPSGEVRDIAPWGNEGAIVVWGDDRAFAASVFLPDPDKPQAGGRLL